MLQHRIVREDNLTAELRLRDDGMPKRQRIIEDLRTQPTSFQQQLAQLQQQ